MAPRGMSSADRACAREAGDAFHEGPLLTWSFCRRNGGRDSMSRLVRLFFLRKGRYWRGLRTGVRIGAVEHAPGLGMPVAFRVPRQAGPLAIGREEVPGADHFHRAARSEDCPDPSGDHDTCLSPYRKKVGVWSRPAPSFTVEDSAFGRWLCGVTLVGSETAPWAARQRTCESSASDSWSRF